jgi:hypothetical protein
VHIIAVLGNTMADVRLKPEQKMDTVFNCNGQSCEIPGQKDLIMDKVNPNVRYDTRDLALDNGISRTPWPWLHYVGHSKLQRVILYLLDSWDYSGEPIVIYEGNSQILIDNDIWRGAVRLSAIERLLFNGEHLTDSQRASLSRSIRRLEREGLVNRERWISDDGYTTHIGLTLRGKYQAEFERDEYPDKQWRK